MEPAPRAAVEGLLRAHLADPASAWSLGVYGAVAAFARGPDEPGVPLEDGRLGLATARGALALTPDVTPFAYETGFTGGWSQAVALCLPAAACARAGRSVVTELGPDAEAARPQERDAILFDLGLGLGAVDACLRSRDPGVLTRLRAACGRPLFAGPLPADLPALSPHRVFRAPVGRIEVFTPIPSPGGRTPDGPHTHVLPRLLRSGRTHAATAPIPPGLVPVAALHPPHPCRDAGGRPAPFDPARHAAFGRLLDAWGDPALVALRRAVLAGRAPEAVAGRSARSAVRAARAQVAARGLAAMGARAGAC
ncbi:hypothetical protein Q8W71_09370 [Methylobacterium sp. NEAU 140]|uniref:DUF6925 family protein n=1 Tax=Methylobacterium sp. NEAU 140 TaxID=3064945 RepID=UPI002736D5F7|nr:hypothetical protein [Methylobacterium sp. NEAU 140]MDP4022830.1 hypothetical protein [Methylobacterium sp. NEAU 140]